MDFKVEEKKVETEEKAKSRQKMSEEERKAKKKIYNKNYREKHKEYHKQKYREWCANNKEKLNAYHLNYYHTKENAKKQRVTSYYKKNGKISSDVLEKLSQKYGGNFGYVIMLKKAVETIYDKAPLLNIQEVLKDIDEYIPKKLLE